MASSDTELQQTTIHQLIREVEGEKAKINEEIEGLKKRLITLNGMIEFLRAKVGSEPANPNSSTKEDGLVTRLEQVHRDKTEGPKEPYLGVLSRAMACVKALQALGGRAKTTEIADWIAERGLGSEHDRVTQHNSTFTTLKRREDLFEKVDKGTWKLRERQ